ncbi:MAG: hypothetical protein ABIK09_17305 [Pseudomonadota bacterium]
MPRNQPDIEFPQSIADAVRRLRRVAVVHSVWSLLTAVLASLLLALAAFGLTISLAAAGVHAQLLAALFPVTLSVSGALVALVMVVLPLVRSRGAAGHAIRLEEASGVTGDLLSAVELHRGLTRSDVGPLGEPNASPELIGEVGRRALDLLQRIPSGVLYPVRRAVLISYGILGVAALLLIAASLRPDAAREALAVVLQVGEDQRDRERIPVEVEGSPAAADESAAVPAPRGTGRPCEELEVTLVDPDYAGARSRAIPVNGRFRVLAGSRLRVSCSGPFADARIELDQRAEGERSRIPMELLPRRDRDLIFAAEISVDGPQELRLLRRLDEAGGNLWHGGVWVFEILEDAVPSCWLVDPSTDIAADRSRSLHVSVEAKDDWGIRRVLLRYRVLEFDEEERVIELAVADDQRDVRVDDVVAIAAFGAEGGQHVVIRAEAEDGRPGEAPGRCRTRPVTLTVYSANEEYRRMVLEAAELRDQTIELLGDVLATHNRQGLGYTVGVVLTFERLSDLLAGLSAQIQSLAESAMVEQDIVRRFAEMEARLGAQAEAAEDCWQRRDERLRGCVDQRMQSLGPELERDVLALADVVDGLLNSYLVHWSQEVEQQRRALSHLVAASGRGATRDGEIFRLAARLRVKLTRMRDLSAAVRPILPTALVAGTATGGRPGPGGLVARADDALEALISCLGNGDQAAATALVDSIGRSVDELNRSIEGEYARVLARSTEGFQKRVVDLKLVILEAKSQCRDMLEELRDFLSAWEKRQESHLKPRLKRRWLEIRRQIRTLRKLSARLDESTYLPLERQGVAELRSALGELRGSLSRARMEDASTTLVQVQERLQSMHYSLELVQRYGGPGQQAQKVRKEIERIDAMVEAAGRLEAEIRQVMPVKQQLLRAGDRVRLDRLVEMGEAITGRLRVAEEKLAAMEAAFPGLHGRVDVLVSQARRAADDARRSLQALDIEGAGTMVDYAVDSLSGAVVVLDEAMRPARRGALVVASGTGGGSVDLKPADGADFPRMLQMLEEAADTPLPEPWRGIVDDYFRRLVR